MRGLIYPVPNPKLPFLGVHFTRRIDGSVEAGPNAVLALAREGYRKTSFHLGEALGTLTYPGFWRMSATYWRYGISEQYRSMRKRSFLESLRKLVPDIRMEDLTSPGAGVRAQAIDRRGNLVQGLRHIRDPDRHPRPQRPIPRRNLSPNHKPPHSRHGVKRVQSWRLEVISKSASTSSARTVYKVVRPEPVEGQCSAKAHKSRVMIRLPGLRARLASHG